MAKIDFEFYSFAADLPELVTPKPDNDVYRGLFRPVGTFALDGAKAKVESIFPYEPQFIVLDDSIEPGQRYAANSQKKLFAHDKYFQSAIRIYLYPDADNYNPTWSNEAETTELFSELYKSLMNPTPLINPDECEMLATEQEIAKVAEITTPHRGLIQESAYPLDGKGKHKNAFLEYCDSMVMRGYEWLPGPERKTFSRQTNGEAKLPPTFNPRPTRILAVNSVRVELVNPHAV